LESEGMLPTKIIDEKIDAIKIMYHLHLSGNDNYDKYLKSEAMLIGINNR
jgi:hypothetical protein